jgi:hypothetical protein
MSTGRSSCPPEWATQLTNLIQAIGGGGVAGLSLQPLCDAAGVTVGYAAAVYNASTNQVTVLRFNAELQPVATLATNLRPCPTGGCDPTGQHFQTSELVCVDTGGGVIREARQVITRDATGAILSSRLENPATGAVMTGAVVECPC